MVQPAVQHQRLDRDLTTLLRFIEVYCHDHHGEDNRQPLLLKSADLPGLFGREIRLCAHCSRLAAHAVTKRQHCPMDPKPSCKNCPVHCYHERYRQEIRKVMAYSGRKLVLRGRLDYLLHLLF